MSKYTFDGNMDRKTLEAYLSRAVTAAGLAESDTLADDLRAIRKLGIKFLGRASGIWYMTEDDEEHFSKAKELAATVHAQDPEIILQSCVFEIVVRRMEEIPIPAYVFTDLGLPVEERHFRLADALFPGDPPGFTWQRSDDPGKDGGIPDLSRDEARLWFYYRATRYIDCGYEALHMGQVHLYTANDVGLVRTYDLFDRIRAYAAKHARRHKVLLDAHTHGIARNGRLLFDYHAMPFTRAALPEEPGRQLVLVREGFSEGGENPNGFFGEAMPYLMEYDNWGGAVVEEPHHLTKRELALKDWWGFDQIGWFANQSKKERDHFLEYTYRWTQVNNPNAFFEAPFRRILSDAAVVMRRADDGKKGLQEVYQINNPSTDCPMGFGQEDVLAACYADGDRLRRKYANPEHLIRYGAREEYDEETGLRLPEKVVVYGSFQPYVGAVEGDSNSEITRMYYVGENTWVLSVVLPYAGTYDYGISTYGTLSATYCVDRYPRSGSGSRGQFTTRRDNSVVRFTFRWPRPAVTVEVEEQE